MTHNSYKFRLYVAGHTRNSVQAVTNLKAFCDAHLPDCHEIEIVDVFEEPKRALEAKILMTPTLVRLDPTPPVRIIGTLSDSGVVKQALGLEAWAA